MENDITPEPDLPGGIDYDRWTPLVKPAPRCAKCDGRVSSLDLARRFDTCWRCRDRMTTRTLDNAVL